MRSDDEEENDYEEDEDEDEEEMRDDGGKEEADFEDDQFDDGEGDGDDGEGDDDDDDDDDEDGEGDGDDEDDDDEEEDEDEDEDDDDEDGNDDDDEGAADQADQEMDVEDAEGASRRSKTEELKPVLEGEQPPPPHMMRRKLFIPGYAEPPSSLTIEAVVGIPLPSAVHAIASTTCLSYLLTGSQDGFVRSYDFWGSVNGAQLMTAQQRAVVGLGEGVHKAGVGRGWWSCEVPVSDGANGSTNKTEPVFSLACQPDGIWALAGSQSGPINLYSLRHEPGHLITSLKGHTSVVSCLQLLDTEHSFISGSWDGAVKEWDLNTGQTVRTYPTHGAQVSSIALRPLTAATSTSPRPENGDGPSISVNVGPDFFTADQKAEEGATANGSGTPAEAPAATEDVAMADTDADADADGEGDDGKSAASYDPLFDDDDAEGEEESKAGDVTMADALAGSIVPAVSTPTPAPKPPNGLGLALPGSTPKASPGLALPGSATTKATTPPTANGSAAPTPHLFGTAASAQASSSRAAAANIPLLSPADYRQFSNDILLTSSMDGQVTLIDRRVASKEGGDQAGVGRLMPGDKAPPWCMSATWLGDGNQVLAGRRNGTIDIWDVRKSSSKAPSLLRTLKTPADSGPVSCIVAFPDGRHIATASQDNIRLWNTVEYYQPEESIKKSRSRPPFRIIAGHHGGIISSMLIDPTQRFLVTASGDRGWQGESTKVVLIHEIKW
ncbi:Transcription factor spt8 [Vanrija albida]|uniref:Transcription factor spt8 n=1 Tax=Vanrija albida TaxID=181172 RepID=A0ABR3PY09_9TREE